MEEYFTLSEEKPTYIGSYTFQKHNYKVEHNFHRTTIKSKDTGFEYQVIFSKYFLKTVSKKIVFKKAT